METARKGDPDGAAGREARKQMVICDMKLKAKRFADKVRKKMNVDRAFLEGYYMSGTGSMVSEMDITFFISEIEDAMIYDIDRKLIRLARGFEPFINPRAFPSSAIRDRNAVALHVVNHGFEL
ncbi:MAG: hypothetical protein LBQ79_01120 [Deltaproteobacteria bacterium]|jgi:hypothetical protein|nr:hypothetical protein [Deltaproteobacteria bacterium]